MKPQVKAGYVYLFGPFSIDTVERVLRCDGRPLQLIPKAVDVLLVLLAGQGHIVEKDSLLQNAWPDSFVDEANLAQNITLLRKALGDSPLEHRYIETIPKRGYRFVESVRRSEIQQTPPQPYADANAIAVLPFLDLSPDHDQEHFTDGLTEELIHVLANIEGLRVVARSSAFQFKGAKVDIRTVGDRLGVSAVLEGSVRKEGKRLRITAQLNNAKDGYHLWSQSYDRKIEDIFALQQEIAHAVASTLTLKFTGREGGSFPRHGTSELEAYHLYLRGRYFRNKVTRDGYQKSTELYEQAIAKAPGYAAAYAALAEAYICLGWNYSIMDPQEAHQKAIAAVNRALELDEMLPDAHVSVGLVKLSYEWDWPGAEAAFRRAICLNPSHANAHHRYAHYLVAMGRFEKAFAESVRCLELDPLDLEINHHLGWHYRITRQYDEAITQLQNTLEMDPNQETTRVYLGQAYARKGMYAEAIKQLHKAAELGDRELDHVTSLGHTNALSGDRDSALRAVKQLQDLRNSTYTSAYSIALVHGALGENEAALEWLHKAYQERNPLLAYLNVEPDWDDFRSQPEFTALLKALGLL